MIPRNLKPVLIPVLIILAWVGLTAGPARAHGEETSIVPETLSVKAGAELKVTVSGLVGTDKARFSLAGMAGKFDLGEFSISSDDFDQVLVIPAQASPGPYRLTVEGGKSKAKAVININ